MICYVTFIVWCISILLLYLQGTPGRSSWSDAILCLRKISSGIGWHTDFIYRIISHWANICWGGEIFHDLSEVEFSFGHFRRDFLGGFQYDATKYWVITSGVHDLVIGNAMWSVVGGLKVIPWGWDLSSLSLSLTSLHDPQAYS